MRRTLRWTGRTLLALTALALLAALVFVVWIGTSLPQLDGERTLAGLAAPVSVARDPHGIPHIRAESWIDAHRALGYVHAQDRLFQMMAMRRAASGRLAEVAGSRALPLDRAMRTFGLRELADADAAALPAEVRALFDAYAEGVNAFLESHAGALPPEFLAVPEAPAPWQAADSLLWLKVMGLWLTADWNAELTRMAMARDLSEEQLEQLYPGFDGPVTLAADLNTNSLRQALAKAALVPQGAGSNEWVIAGKATASGKPILANDPHLRFTVPNTWYLARLETPEGMLAGATSPGFPLLVLGHNSNVAWGLTTTYGDTSDVFVERLDPENADRYLTPEGSAPFAMREEVIDVRFDEARRIIVRETRHGPVISDGDGGRVPPAPDEHVLALAHVALLPGDRTAEALYGAQRAENLDGVMAALTKVDAPMQNIVVADTAGKIGLIAPARVPVRRSPPAALPVPGWTGEHDWEDFLPPDELPRTIAPASGRLINANNKLVGPEYPHELGNAWAPPLRAEAIVEALDEQPVQTVDASQTVQLDTRSLLARRLLAHMDWERLAAVAELEVIPSAALEAMRAWDGRMERRIPEPLMFYAWAREALRPSSPTSWWSITATGRRLAPGDFAATRWRPTPPGATTSGAARSRAAQRFWPRPSPLPIAS